MRAPYLSGMHTAKILIGTAALFAMSSGADSGERGQNTNGDGWSYDYNVPLALPPYGYTPGFWGYGGKRYYDKFGNYRKYQHPGGAPYDGPVDSGPFPGSLR